MTSQRVNLDMVNYFHNLIVDMRKWGYVDGKDLFGFGYDFRQSNRCFHLGGLLDSFTGLAWLQWVSCLAMELVLWL